MSKNRGQAPTKLRDVAAKLVETTNADNRMPGKPVHASRAPAAALDGDLRANEAETDVG